MSLTLSAQPGFTELPDSTFDSGAALTSAAMKSLNADAKFGAVRNEQFWGFYRNGETVVLPVSQSDGYEYSRAELIYSWSWYSSGSATAPLNGTQNPPVPGPSTGDGTVLGFQAIVDPSSGAVTTIVAYYKSQQQNVNDGILMVIVFAQRNR